MKNNTLINRVLFLNIFMINSVTIPCDTPLIVKTALFAKELLNILEWLSLEWTKIWDITSTVIWKILEHDVTYFQRFSDATEISSEWNIVTKAEQEYVVSIKWEWVNAHVVVVEMHSTGWSAPAVWAEL